ncbi:hypothetical protein KIW84_056473 [Lathyrus oleraceus]|uniref:Uncharacterized protein n=1 Tax=Pisum sativum TaxID=3888 RepID=A0A9D5ACN2_PEA|nr:hypothetical protein KIW84_052936 [Pisum sativum]KAI5411394.1 hypothetical protein KIW84_056471 [Pisum sativum]KAI5411396.1 hypothetical protein KIW84_056473 [Pisum sativum]
MEPFLQVFGRLNSTPNALSQSDAVKYAFIGLMHDLRGIAMATNSRRTYGFLFDWLYPAHMPILLKSLAHYADAPEAQILASYPPDRHQPLSLCFDKLMKDVKSLCSWPGCPPNTADKFAGLQLANIWAAPFGIPLHSLFEAKDIAGNIVQAAAKNKC